MPEGGGIKHTLSAPQGLHLQHNLVQILCGHLVSDCLQEEAIPCEIHGSESLPVPRSPQKMLSRSDSSSSSSRWPPPLPKHAEFCHLWRGERGRRRRSSVIMFVEFKQTFAVSKLHPNCRFLRPLTDKMEHSDVLMAWKMCFLVG